MAEPKFTSRPWVARVCNNDAEWEVVILDPSQTWNEPHDRCWYVATVMDDADGVSAEDNAHLIAAAPEFFSSAKSLIEAWDARPTGAQQIVTGKSDADLQKQAMAAIEGLRAAIAKAEGGAS